ncbi:MAG: hypothetical protein Phog2KO_49950 [Phototrophicaceae bacterium]
MLKRFFVGALVLAIATLGAVNVFADHFNPSVTVNNQVSVDGTVTIAQVNSAEQGFIVIHADNDGSFGQVIGFASVYPGANYNVVVDIDTTLATSTLYAMLHSDTGEVGVYEFGTVDGADGPVAVDGEVVTPAFTAEIVAASDQMMGMNAITIDSVTSSVDGFVVVHAGDAESFGAVLGFAAVPAGTSTDVVVELDGEMSDVVWPMLHVDTGEAGVYEFGTVEGVDGPVVVEGSVATMPIWTVPHMRVADQIVVHGDGMDMMDMTPTVYADSVLSADAGWLVIHADNDGAPGPVLGQTLLEAGLNTDVAVELEGDVTPVLWPMLHVDTGEAGVYEFGTVEGADGPVVINDNVVTYAINAAPSIVYAGETDGTNLTVESALIDATGWLVIHADNDGAPGPVLGQVQLYPGLNNNLTIALEGDVTETVFPMLHYDTGESGQYEFGTVEGADAPVAVGGNVITGPLTPSAMME